MDVYHSNISESKTVEPTSSSTIRKLFNYSMVKNITGYEMDILLVSQEL